MIRLIGIILLTLSLAACGDDDLPPTTPQNLQATAVSTSEINLEWEASTDQISVEGYEVHRGGAFLAQVINATAYADTGLANATEYCYAVLAYDAEGNKSDKSNEACATTLDVPDTEAPTIPTGLIVNAISPSTIELGWSNSADNVAVMGYGIYNGMGSQEKITDTAGTSFIHKGLSADTIYCYFVTAYDRTGNESEGSDTECDITETASP